MRALALVSILAGCDAGSPQVHPSEHQSPSARQNVKRTSELMIGNVDLDNLPTHAIIVTTFGMGGFHEIEVVDLDAEMMRVDLQDWDPSHGLEPQHTTDISFSHASIPLLRAHGEAAWREVQHGKMPDVTDVAQSLYVIDGAQAFELNGTLIGSGVTNFARPAARDLVDEVQAIDRKTIESWR